MSELSIKLKGFPEKVQRLADAIDDAFPGMLAWVESLSDGDENLMIRIEGHEFPLMPMKPLLAA